MLQVFLLFALLSNGSQVPWEPVPSHQIAPKETHGRGDEFKPLQWLALSSIRIYQNTLSRCQGDICNFTPSCSHYGHQAIKRYGLLWGTLMAGDRMERCNYFCWSYAPRYYETTWAEGRGLKLYDPPERNWLFRSGATLRFHSPRPWSGGAGQGSSHEGGARRPADVLHPKP